MFVKSIVGLESCCVIGDLYLTLSIDGSIMSCIKGKLCQNIFNPNTIDGSILMPQA